jgi:hypothetical protein
MAFVAVLALAGCGIGPASSQDAPPIASGALASCEEFTPYPDLESLSAALETEGSIHGIVGADIATGVRLPGDDMLVAFGDTILDSLGTSPANVRNSLLAFSEDRACLVLGHDGSAFVADRADGVGYWPTSLADATHPGVAVEPTAAMFAQRVRETTDGGFVNLGPALAEVVPDHHGIPQVVSVTDIGGDDPSRKRIGWGAASWRADDGNIYIYGTANPETDLVFGWSLHVARVRAEQVFDVSAWQYWDGQAWGDDPAASATLIPAVGGVSQTLSVFAEDGMWYAVSKQDDYLGSEIVVWSAPGPMGPFVSSGSVASRPSDVAGGILRYAVVAHPTLYPQDGTVVVSISQNTTDETALERDPTIYRPEFLRVPLPAPPQN